MCFRDLFNPIAHAKIHIKWWGGEWGPWTTRFCFGRHTRDVHVKFRYKGWSEQFAFSFCPIPLDTSHAQHFRNKVCSCASRLRNYESQAAHKELHVSLVRSSVRGMRTRHSPWANDSQMSTKHFPLFLLSEESVDMTACKINIQVAHPALRLRSCDCKPAYV
jgi:hypothetical protein